MVRNYKRKEGKNKWKDDDMKLATESVNNTQMTVSGAAKHFGVPRETLRRRVMGRVSMNARAGRPTTLTKQEEVEIVETCQVFAEWGFGLSKEDTLYQVCCSRVLPTVKAEKPFQEWSTR